MPWLVGLRTMAGAIALGLVSASFASGAGAIAWRGWDDGVFATARVEHRFVLLDLEAVWCHWCHVMDATTYQDPEVVLLIAARFLAVRVDQDARPDLANRYEKYGWPATVIFDGSGAELVKLSGYLPPRRMAALLQAVIDDPTPGPSVVSEEPVVAAENAALAPALRAEMEAVHRSHYDTDEGGWGRVHKFLHADSVEYSLVLGGDGDGKAEAMARTTLDRQLQLVDPVWGGVYQYSDGGVWTNPHFEKIMTMQADNLRLYTLAWLRYADPRYRAGAEAVRGYLLAFLRGPAGAFYASQDADLRPGEHAESYFALDDAGRRALGLPRVDRSVYARENGWAIAALATLHGATGEDAPLAAAVAAAERMLADRGLEGGGFRHGAGDRSGPYLGDTLAMGRGFLELYAVTAERRWLAHADAAGTFIARRFVAGGEDGAGLLTAVAAPGQVLPPRPLRAENIAAARFLNLLGRYTGKESHARTARAAMRWLAAPAVATRRSTAGVLLAAREIEREPVHVTVVGPRRDPRAKALFAAARRCPDAYRRIEWWDRSEGKLANAVVGYPELDEPAAFRCAGGRCSRPITDPARLAAWAPAAAPAKP